MGVVETAQEYLGKVEYVFGADDIPGGKGDCSSFTQYVFKQNGVNIGRDTESQWGQGKTVSKANLQPGDLVFFQGTYENNHKDNVSHVGISLGGDSFIHLGGSGVVTASLSSEYWTEHWLGAKRIESVTGSDGSEGSGTAADWGLEWWGDVVVVCCIVIMIIIGMIAFMRAFNIKMPGIGGLTNG